MALMFMILFLKKHMNFKILKFKILCKYFWLILIRDQKFEKLKDFILEELDLLSDLCEGRNPECS